MTLRWRSYIDRDDFARDFPEEFAEQEKQAKQTIKLYIAGVAFLVAFIYSIASWNLQKVIWITIERVDQLVSAKK